MRQGQQNRRGRGRNNNRKNHNPLTRSFESNGPDVKIRGTPAHIAEKYLTLARDAQSSGDPVLGENYLQHAEHYTRIIMAYREQLQQPGELPNGNGQRLREPGDVVDEFGDEEGEDLLDEGFQPPHPPREHRGSAACLQGRAFPRLTPDVSRLPPGSPQAILARAAARGERDLRSKCICARANSNGQRPAPGQC